MLAAKALEDKIRKLLLETSARADVIRISF